MSLLVLHKSDALSIASDKLVYSEAELGTLKTLLEHAQALAQLHEEQELRVVTAEQQAVEKGHAAGFAQGYAEGKTKAVQEQESVRRSISIEQENLQNTASRLAFEIVRKLTDNLDSGSLLSALALSAAQTFNPEEELVLRVHDSQTQSVRARLGAQGKSNDSVFSRVVGDPGVERQACIIESAEARVVADLETQLSLMESRLGIA